MEKLTQETTAGTQTTQAAGRELLMDFEAIKKGINAYSIAMLRDEPEYAWLIESLIDQAKRFELAQMTLGNFRRGNINYRMVENGEEFYQRQSALYLKKTVRKLLEANYIAKSKGLAPVLNFYVDKENEDQITCVALAFSEAMWEQVRVDILTHKFAL